MTATAQDPGIRQRLYLAGLNIMRGPESVQEVSQRAETAERMADTFTVIDRPYLFAGAPDVVTKYRWALAFPRIGSTDYRAFARAEAMPGFFDFCLWKPISEVFSGDGVATDFKILRRNALTQVPGGSLPVGASTTYAVQAYVDGTLVTTPSFGTPDARGVTQITFAVAPTAGDSNVEIFYVPLFSVRIADPHRDFPVAHRETRGLSLEEI